MAVSSRGQTALPHAFSEITVDPNQGVSLVLTGRPPNAFRPFFDIYPVEVSDDLKLWKAHATLVRTNLATNVLIHFDSEHTKQSRYYRTPTNLLVTPLAKPTGPFPIGRVSRLVTDPSRTNRYNIRTNSSFMITITYPAQSIEGALPDRYVEGSLAAVFSEPIVGQMYAFSTLDAPIRTTEAKFALILYSHGYGSNRRSHTEKAEDLASHGYVVTAMDHIDCSGSVFPDGRLIRGISSPIDESVGLRELPDRVRDVTVVLDELARMNEGESPFAGRLDLDRVGVFGHSFGAATVAEAARVDERIKAGILFDPFFFGAVELRRAGMGKPLLSMYRADRNDLTLFNKALSDAYNCQVRNTEHNTFVDLWRSGLANLPSRRATEAIRACTRSFFDKYLKHDDDQLLMSVTNSFPVIFNYMSK